MTEGAARVAVLCAMRNALASLLLFIAAITACKKDNAVVDEPGCSTAGPISIDSGGSYFTLPTAFTPNGDGTNDVFFAFTEKIDTADFSLVIRSGSETIFSADNPYFIWAPAGYTGRRSVFDLDVRFRTQQGALIESCSALTIPKADSFFTCAEDIGGLYFADQVDIINGKFKYPTGEEECP